MLLVKNFSAKCVRLHRAADPGHEAACQSVAVEDGGGDGGDSHSHRGNSLLVLQGGEFLILDDVTDGDDFNQVRTLRSQVNVCTGDMFASQGFKVELIL